jgi:hypothetical protein
MYVRTVLAICICEILIQCFVIDVLTLHEFVNIYFQVPRNGVFGVTP